MCAVCACIRMYACVCAYECMNVCVYVCMCVLCVLCVLCAHSRVHACVRAWARVLSCALPSCTCSPAGGGRALYGWPQQLRQAKTGPYGFPATVQLGHENGPDTHLHLESTATTTTPEQKQNHDSRQNKSQNKSNNAIMQPSSKAASMTTVICACVLV